MASRKEFGWLAHMSKGPLRSVAVFSGNIKPGQNIFSAHLISGFRRKYIKTKDYGFFMA
jgi:hypothetical protein